jgi:hypothetical protein
MESISVDQRVKHAPLDPNPINLGGQDEIDYASIFRKVDIINFIMLTFTCSRFMLTNESIKLHSNRR